VIVTRATCNSRGATAAAGCIVKRRFRSGNMVRNSNRRQEEESGSPHGARRVSARHWRPTLALAVCIASVGWAPQSVHAQRGYDREENPTGIWQGWFLFLFQRLLVSVYKFSVLRHACLSGVQKRRVCAPAVVSVYG